MNCNNLNINHKDRVYRQIIKYKVLRTRRYRKKFKLTIKILNNKLKKLLKKLNS